MSKMCSLSKVMRSTDGASYVNLMNNPKFYCKRCGRVANEKEFLCRPFPLTEESSEDLKIKEVEIAVRRDGVHKHYVLEQNEEVPMAENQNSDETSSCSEETEEHICNCTPENSCGEECNCKEEKVIHVADLFRNEDGSFKEEWVIEEDTPTDEVPTIQEFKGEPFIKSLKNTDKKDKKIKKLKMSDLRNIIREEIKKALAEK